MLIPTSLSQDQAAKTNMVSVVRIQVFSIMLHMTDHVPMKLEKHYTCWIEGDSIHIPNKSTIARLATGLLVSNA